MFASVVLVLSASSTDCSQQGALGIMDMRFHKLPAESEYCGHLLAIDEATACLGESDRQELRNMHGRVSETVGERAAFVTQLRANRSAIGVPSSKPGCKRAKVPANSLSDYLGPAKMPCVEAILQKDLKQFMPPDASLWIARNISA